MVKERWYGTLAISSFLGCLDSITLHLMSSHTFQLEILILNAPVSEVFEIWIWIWDADAARMSFRRPASLPSSTSSAAAAEDDDEDEKDRLRKLNAEFYTPPVVVPRLVLRGGADLEVVSCVGLDSSADASAWWNRRDKGIVVRGTLTVEHVRMLHCPFFFPREAQADGDDANTQPERLTVGDGVRFDHDVFIQAAAAVDIASRCVLGPGIRIYTSFPSSFSHPTSAGGYEERCVPVRIRGSATLCGSAIVLPGVSIGANATIGAGSVVTRSVPDGCLVCGNPARILRYPSGP
jgi:hypothetical protein